VIETDWHGCYRGGWRGLIVPDAFAHPAKFSRSLIARIFDHMREEGWLPPGSTVLDPFGGVALGALDCMRIGCHWVGIELEEKFVTLGVQNIALWNARYAGKLPTWGSAVILQGDSRHLLAWQFAGPKVEAVVGSPPYAEAQAHPSLGSVSKDDWGKEGRDIVSRRGLDADYGSSPGQLGQMREGSVEAVVSSPPYSVDDKRDYTGEERDRRKLGEDFKGHGRGNPRVMYGDSVGQLTRESQDTFWSASKQILEQVFLAVKPGGHAVFVVKDYVRKGKRVPFADQWRQLCEAVGFRTLHCHRAWLVEDNGTQGQTDGGEQRLKTERKSFFRRLSEFHARAKAYWPTYTRNEQAGFVIAARWAWWEDHWERMAKFCEEYELPRSYKRRQILTDARAMGYRAAGQPEMNTPSDINWETVWCLERP